VAQHDTLDASDRARIRTCLGERSSHPVVSVVMPTGHTKDALLRESIASVVAQLYPCWELCVVEDVGTPASFRATLRDRMGRDPRVRSVCLDGAGDPTTVANAGLELATGEFVTFLQAGDLLPEQALHEVTAAFLAEGPADLVYTDEDTVDAAGRRLAPWFKPGWDPDLLLAQHYTGHLAVYRREVVNAVGRFRPGVAGIEHYDLALRVTALIAPDRVRHVPAICYHRRVGHGSETTDGRPAPEVEGLARRAVREQLERQGHAGVEIEPAPLAPGCRHIIWPLITPAPLVSVITPTRDRADLLEQCLDGLLHRTDYPNLELLVVDNESRQASTLALFARLQAQDPRVRVLRRAGAFNFSALNNAAAREARGEVLVLLNNDIEVIGPGWLRELVSHALRPEVGAVGAKLLYPDGRLQHAGIVLGPHGAATHVHRLADRDDPGYFGQLALARTLSAVSAACMAVRASVFFEVGGLDDTNLTVAFNDVDFCLRLADHGYRVVWTPAAELFHRESASRGSDMESGKRERFLRELQHLRQTWGEALEANDPFHNPNLLFSWDHFEVPSAPRRQKPWRMSPRSPSAAA
jgi:GT2 family glycosyltransferase